MGHKAVAEFGISIDDSVLVATFHKQKEGDAITARETDSNMDT